MYCTSYCNCPYASLAVEHSANGPFAFTVRCLGCAPDCVGHLPDCSGTFGHGILHRDGGVDIIHDGGVTHYHSCADAYEHYEYDYQVDFVWGPVNPEAGLSFYLDSRLIDRLGPTARRPGAR